MTLKSSQSVISYVAQRRQQQGKTVAELAAAVGVTRQTIYAMENGSFVPNTAIALRLATVLGTKVEQLFQLSSDPVDVELLPKEVALAADQPVQLCRVGTRLLAVPAIAAMRFLPSADALLGQVEEWQCPDNSLVIAGCDPALSVLARHAQSAGIHLVLVHRNSSKALELLKGGYVHIAGTHLRDRKTGESNLPAIRKLFKTGSVAAISFASWEQGILTRPTNPKSVKNLTDLARKNVRLANRDRGSGTRDYLDQELNKLSIGPEAIRGYQNELAGHFAVAFQVQEGKADCGIATRSAALYTGLEFIPLLAERYDFVVHQRDLNLPAVQAVFNILNDGRFRRELQMLARHDVTTTGSQVL